MTEAFHTLQELRARIGAAAIFVTPVALSMRCERLRGRVGRVRRVLRSNVELDFDTAGIWRWPFSEVLLQSHPLFVEAQAMEAHRASARRAARKQRPRMPRASRASRSRRPRDSQRQRLYDWEHTRIRPRDRKPLTLEACQSLADRVRADARLARAVRVGDGRGSKRARWILSTRRIELPLWARRHYVVLHEMAHAICDERHAQSEQRETIPVHGAEYLRIYVDLVAKYLGLDRLELEESVREAKLRIAPSDAAVTPVAPPMQLALFPSPI